MYLLSDIIRCYLTPDITRSDSTIILFISTRSDRGYEYDSHNMINMLVHNEFYKHFISELQVRIMLIFQEICSMPSTLLCLVANVPTGELKN